MGSELAIDLRPDVAEDTRRLLPTALREQTRLGALVLGIGDVLQDRELLLFRLLDERTLDSAAGIHLDHWGERVQELRGSLQDSDYRRFIKAKVRALGWAPVAGRLPPVDEMLAIWELVTQADAVRYFSGSNASYTLQARRGSWLGDEVVERVVRLMVDLVTPAGVAVTLVEYLGDGWPMGGPLGPLGRRLYP